MAVMPLSASQANQPDMNALRTGFAAGMAQYKATGSFNGQTPAQNQAAAAAPAGMPAASPLVGGSSNGGMWGAVQGAVNMQKAPLAMGLAGVPASATSQTAAPQPNTGGQIPPQSTGYAPPKFDAAGIAASRVAAQRAALANSVNAYDASRKQGFDYTTKNTQDQRNLDAANFHETNNPFSGKYVYDKTNILRNNGIQDTQNQMQYNNDIAAENQKLADFDAGAPGMQQDLENQLNQQNQASTLALNQDNRAQQTQDHNFSQDTITNNRNAANDAYNQGQDTIKNNLATDNYNLNAQKQMADLTGYIADGKGGYMPTSTQQKQDLTDAWTESTNLGYVSPSLSKLTGIPAGTQTQQAKNQAQQIAISQQSADSGTKNAATSAENSAWAKDPKNPDNLYKQSEIAKNNAQKPLTADSYKTDPAFSADVAHMKATPADVAKLDANPQPFINAYGYDGYLALRKAAGLDQ